MHPMRSRRQLRYLPLLASAVSVFLGLNILGDLLGVLLHVEVPWMFGGWVKLAPSFQESTVQWIAWGICLLIATHQSIATLVSRNRRPEPVAALVFLILPSLSVLIALMSPHVGATLLVGSGFLMAYEAIMRSQVSLGIEPSFAQRLVCAVAFTLLALTAVGGVICVLLWQAGAFFVWPSGISQTLVDMLLGILAADLKAFYLAQPMLTVIFLALALAAIVVLLREPAQELLTLIFKSLTDGPMSHSVSQQDGGPHSSLAYLALLGALGLAIAVTAYRILQPNWPGGADFPWYVRNLRFIAGLPDVVLLLRGDRGLFLLLLSLAGTVTSVSAVDVVRFAPAMLSVLLALSTFLLVREGTGRLWVSSLAAVLSVVSAQTTLGMYAGIMANWFALSIANFTLAMVVRSIRLRSLLAAVGSIVLSLVLLAGYAYMWVVAVVELLLVLVVSISAFRAVDRRMWKHDAGILSAVILCIILIPFALSVLTAPLLGLQGLDPSTWLALGWRYAQAVRGETIESMLSALQLSLGQIHMELPFVALLSILGLLDHAPRTRCFTRIIAAMVLVPFAVELMPSAPSYFALRGLYLIPLYVLAALGVESVVRRVNAQESPWRIPTGLAFAGAFTVYLLLSQLAYTLLMFGLPLLSLR
jgi:hypothetical protein